LGSVIAMQLAQDGYEVWVHANSQLQKAERLVEDIRQAGGCAHAICFDVTDIKATEKSIETVLKTGAIQVLVNNAGIHDDAVMAGMTHEQWQKRH